MIDHSILSRLIYSKYLLYNGNESFEKGSIISDGLALLSYQDAVEMLLRTIAAEVEAKVTDPMNFDAIINSIEASPNNKPKKIIQNKTILHELNRARIGFKHFGIIPRHDVVQNLSNKINAFFQQTVYTFFNIEADKLSFKELINHHRIRNKIALSEDLFDKGEYDKCILEVSKAFCLVFDKIRDDRKSSFSHDGYQRYFETAFYSCKHRVHDNSLSHFTDDLSNTFKDIDKKINEHSLFLALLKNKIDISAYERFININSVSVDLSMSGAFCIDIDGNDKKVTQENALFCLNFVVDMAIKIINNNKAPEIISKRKFKTIKKTNVVIPSSEEIEVIRSVDENEILSSYSMFNYDETKYFAIIQDGDLAYIAKDDVKEITSNEKI